MPRAVRSVRSMPCCLSYLLGPKDGRCSSEMKDLCAVLNQCDRHLTLPPVRFGDGFMELSGFAPGSLLQKPGISDPSRRTVLAGAAAALTLAPLRGRAAYRPDLDVAIVGGGV